MSAMQAMVSEHAEGDIDETIPTESDSGSFVEEVTPVQITEKRVVIDLTGDSDTDSEQPMDGLLTQAPSAEGNEKGVVKARGYRRKKVSEIPEVPPAAPKARGRAKKVDLDLRSGRVAEVEVAAPIEEAPPAMGKARGRGKKTPDGPASDVIVPKKKGGRKAAHREDTDESDEDWQPPNRKKFTAKEDKQLLAAVGAHGPNWKKVAEMVPNRTRIQLENRFQELTG
jgi:hypothetical protein